MSFIARVAPTLFRRVSAPVFTRSFGGEETRIIDSIVEFSIHSVADDDTMEIEAEKGSTILDVCQENGVEITGISKSFISYQAVCSGGGSCGSCHVILPKDLFDAVEPPNDLEKELLTNVVFGVKPT